MTELLVLLTLVYAAVLVAALAVSLLVILTLLRRVAGLLGEIGVALGEVEAGTRAIGPLVEQVRGRTAPLVEDVRGTARLPAGAHVTEIGPVRVVR